jgi:hypothetical protein
LRERAQVQFLARRSNPLDQRVLDGRVDVFVGGRRPQLAALGLRQQRA